MLAFETRLPGVIKRARNAAVDRRAHFGEFEIEPRRFERRRRRADVVAGRARIRRQLIEILLRNHVLRDQALAAVVVRCRQRRLRTRAAQLGTEAVDLGLERTRIDPEQQLAFLDARAFGELHRVDESADARTDLDAVDRLQTPAEFFPIAQRLGDHAGDRHRGSGWRGGRAAGCGMPATREHGHGGGE